MESLKFGNLLSGFLLPNCPTAQLLNCSTAQVPAQSSERCDIFEQLISLRILIHCLIESTRRRRRKLYSPALQPPFGLGSKLVPWRWLHLICNANATGPPPTAAGTKAPCWSSGRVAWHFIICMRSVFVVCKSQVIGVKQLPGTWPLRPVTECTLNLTETKPLRSCNNIYYLKAAHQNRTATAKEGVGRGWVHICHVACSLKQLNVLAKSNSHSSSNCKNNGSCSNSNPNYSSSCS